jgi:predicted RNase H-like nuclease
MAGRAARSVVIAGVDGCRAGWVTVLGDAGGGPRALAVHRSFAQLAAMRPAPALIAIDIPIGLPDQGARPCDVEARRLLGRPRASSVYPAPPRSILHQRDYARAKKALLASEGKGLSRQSWAIVRKVRDVDNALRDDPSLRRYVFEVHPEVSFFHMAGRRPARHPKRRRAGREERLTLLRREFGDVIDYLLRARPADMCSIDDVLDACAAFWTGRRILAKTAQTVVWPPVTDRWGLRMRIVA